MLDLFLGYFFLPMTMDRQKHGHGHVNMFSETFRRGRTKLKYN